MTPLNKEEFQRRLAHNTKIFLRQQKSNTFTPSLYYFWDKRPKELTTLQYRHKYSDIFSATVIGALPASQLYGEDAYILKAGKLSKIELKTSYITHTNIWKSSTGTVYAGTSQIEYAFKGLYNHNSYDPEIDNYLICCDTSGKWDTDVIGVWKLDGEIGHELLDQLQDKKITLRKFMDHGYKLDGRHLNIPIIGWDKYISVISKRIPVKICT